MEETESKEIAERQEARLAEREDFAKTAADWLKATGAKLTDKQTEQFLQISRAFGLNPFKREIYATQYGDKFNIIVGYETYLKRAERTGMLDGWQCEISADGKSATCTIWKKGWSHPFVHSVERSEYDTGKSVWATKPKTMLKKVATAQAMRLCFPDEFGGMPYTSEETDSIDEPPMQVVEEQSAAETPAAKVARRTWSPTEEMKAKMQGAMKALESAAGDEYASVAPRFRERYKFICGKSENILDYEAFLDDAQILAEQYEAAKN